MTTAEISPAPPPIAPTRSSTTVLWTLIGAALALKAATFAWDPYVGGLHGTTTAGAALTLTGIGWCAGQLVSGTLTDRLGHRRTLTLLMALSAAACAAFAAASSLSALLICSTLLGFTMNSNVPPSHP